MIIWANLRPKMCVTSSLLIDNVLFWCYPRGKGFVSRSERSVSIAWYAWWVRKVCFEEWLLFACSWYIMCRYCCGSKPKTPTECLYKVAVEVMLSKKNIVFCGLLRQCGGTHASLGYARIVGGGSSITTCGIPMAYWVVD